MVFDIFKAISINDYCRIHNHLIDGFSVDTRHPVHSGTPLIEASSMGCLNIVALLLSFGSSLDAVDRNGKTALDHALEFGDLPVIRLLI